MIEGSITIQRLLASMKRLDASDLHIKVGVPPTYRIGGHLRPVNAPPITEDEADHLLDPLLNESRQRRFDDTGNLDFAWHLPDGDRFRINMDRSGSHVHAAIRRVKAEIPNYGQLHLPDIYGKLVEETNDGLVLVVGVTGCGKSSTLAAMIDHVNAIQDMNIITIEDPIEYRFTPKRSIISQREIGIASTHKTALPYVVRQDPTSSSSERCATETVLSAIRPPRPATSLPPHRRHHADLARMLEFFRRRADFIRSSLSTPSARLRPETPPRRQFETRSFRHQDLLGSPSSAQDPRRRGRGSRHHQPVHRRGHASLRNSLAELVEKDWVDIQTAMGYAPNREALESMLRGVKVKSASLVNRIRA